jgi:hypothetical protein
MQLQDKKKKTYWVESPNGENYLRHYKVGDGEITLFDGHFGKWIDCFREIEVTADAEITGEAESGLVKVVEKNSDGKDVERYYLPDFYLPYDDIMIPYDARVLSKKDRFTRIRTTNKSKSWVY